MADEIETGEDPRLQKMEHNGQQPACAKGSFYSEVHAPRAVCWHALQDIFFHFRHFYTDSGTFYCIIFPSNIKHGDYRVKLLRL